MSRLLLVMLVAGLAGCSESSGPVFHVSSAPALPDPVGFAGMAAGFSDAGLIAAGGANFPGKPPWEGGVKNFSRTVFVFRDDTWKRVGELPRGVAYAACAGTRAGLVVAGGCDAHACFADVSRLVAENGALRVEPLPALPAPVAFAASAVFENRLFVIGGVDSPDATHALASVYALDLARPGAGWARVPAPPGPGRMLAAAGVLDGRLYVMGGVSLAAVNGKPVRTYHAEVCSIGADLADWRVEKSLPGPLAASPSPAAAMAGGLVLAGGDPGAFAKSGKPPWEHPGQPRAVLLYRPSGESRVIGETPVGVVTAPVAIGDDAMTIVSGESAPGVRTNAVTRIGTR